MTQKENKSDLERAIEMVEEASKENKSDLERAIEMVEEASSILEPISELGNIYERVNILLNEMYSTYKIL